MLDGHYVHVNAITGTMTATTSNLSAGGRIAAWRRAAGWSQQLEDRLSVSRSYLGDVEAGRSEPSGALLTALTSTTDVSADWLLTGKGEMERGRPAQIADGRAAYDDGHDEIAARVRDLMAALTYVDRVHQDAILADAISRAVTQKQLIDIRAALQQLQREQSVQP